jgi:hypothetical protein
MWAGAAQVPANAVYYQNWTGTLNATSLSSFIPTFLTTPRLASIPKSSSVYPKLNVTLSPWAADAPPISSAWQIHPVSGLALHFFLASQANVYLSPLNTSFYDEAPVDPPVFFPDVWQGLLPIFWAQGEGGLNYEQAQWVREMSIVEEGAIWAPWVMGTLAVVCGLITMWAALQWTRAVKGAGGKKKAVKRKPREDGVGEKARLKVSSNGSGRVWYGQPPQEPTEVEEETSLEEEEEEPEERLRIGYRY